MYYTYYLRTSSTIAVEFPNLSVHWNGVEKNCDGKTFRQTPITMQDLEIQQCHCRLRNDRRRHNQDKNLGNRKQKKTETPINDQMTLTAEVGVTKSVRGLKYVELFLKKIVF